MSFSNFQRKVRFSEKLDSQASVDEDGQGGEENDEEADDGSYMDLSEMLAEGQSSENDAKTKSAR